MSVVNAVQFLTLVKNKKRGGDVISLAQKLSGEYDNGDVAMKTALKKSLVLVSKALVSKSPGANRNRFINLVNGKQKEILNNNRLARLANERAPDTVWNPPMNGISRKNVNTRINFVPNRTNSRFRNAVQHLDKDRFISRGTYGSVHSLKGTDRYVMKIMKFADPGHGNGIDIKSFFTEVRVGSMKDIEQVGPRIYAWKLTRNAAGRATHGSYIMDSFASMTPAGCTFTNISAYAYDEFKKHPLTNSHPFVAKLKETLVRFWTITKGYHGDLPGNIGVIHVKGKPLEIRRVILFDYAAHKRFKRSNLPTSFKNLVNLINKEGKDTQNKFRGVNFNVNENSGRVRVGLRSSKTLNNYMGAPLISPRHKQAYRSNTNVLRTIHRIVPKLGNRKTTLMNMLSRESVKRTAMTNSLISALEYTMSG